MVTFPCLARKPKLRCSPLARNGIFLHKDVEKALDLGIIAIVPDLAEATKLPNYLHRCCQLRHKDVKIKPNPGTNKKTYNTRDSLVVTDPTTSLALTGLSMGERTGSRVFQWICFLFHNVGDI
ncbi:hypothetical protein GE21DRAFT_1275187 [Neurospora crassa]|nr:hypothetical protein GE21DRAFT_1275187 [Neurospora crassa]